MIDPLLLAIDALAVYRFSRLVVADSILDVPRRWLLRRWPGDETEFVATEVGRRSWEDITVGVTDKRMVVAGTLTDVIKVGDNWVAAKPRYFGTWLSCVWCVSPYVAAAVVMLRSWWDWWQYPALVAAMSAVAGIIYASTNE